MTASLAGRLKHQERAAGGSASLARRLKPRLSTEQSPPPWTLEVRARRSDPMAETTIHNESPESLGNDVNGYASPSPTIEAGRVYIHFGSYGTACLDTKSFNVLWQRRDLPCRHYRGPSSSPILFDNLLILTLDGIDLQY